MQANNRVNVSTICYSALLTEAVVITDVSDGVMGAKGDVLRP